MASKQRRYHNAAVGYFIYGLIYLTGAIYLVQVGASARAMGSGSIWWFLLGGAMVVVLPILIWREFKWITRLLAVLVFVRIIGLLRLIFRWEWDTVPLPWDARLSEGYGAAFFLGVSLFACYLLVRAGWSGRLKRNRTAP